jgi:cytochrome c oxidase subunit 4
MATHAHAAHDHAHEERRYIVVFVWLAVLTAVEIGITYLPMSKIAIGAGLVILAAGKAALVALYYMHLVNEKRTLTYIAVTPMVLCVFLVLMLLPDLGAITRLITSSVGAATGTPAAH